MTQIAFLAPDEKMYATAQEALCREHPSVRIAKGLLSEGVRAARKLAAEGVEIIVTRGGTATAIKEADIKVTVVEVPITGFDVIRAAEEARTYGERIAVVAFAPMITGIECLQAILKVEIRRYIITNEFEAESRVLQAFKEGADVVLGGVITAKAAHKYNLPHVLIASGSEGIIQAVQEAKRIAYARELEKVKVKLFSTVLDYAYEGIISVDQDERITIFNPTAQRITRTNRYKAVGQKIGDIWPELNLGQVIAAGKDELGQIIKVNGKQILCNKAPIIVNGKTAGAVATFQDTGRIQQMEARIRQAIYSQGHVARFTFDDIWGTSPEITRTVHMAKKFAMTQSSILILGETGTGKEVFAQSIHNFSTRAHGPFVAVNCAALPSQILESELFGYVGGAFTGANKEGKPGLFEAAHGGTIFLDEIAEMDYVTQGKLLRVLQEKKVVRLGSNSVIPVDVRVIAATNKSLKKLIAENKFRPDLYYRLNVLRLRIPPLRERQPDLLVYVQNFLDIYTAKTNRRLTLEPAAQEVLNRFPWAGNVRELQNVIERIVAVCNTDTVPAALVLKMLEDDFDDEAAPPPDPEREEIRQALEKARGKHTEAAKILGISRSTLWRKMRKLDMT